MDLYKSLHVENSTKDPIFQQSNPLVSAATVGDLMVDYTDYIKRLSTYMNVLVIAGEYDMRDGPNSQEVWLKKLFPEMWDQDRKVYNYGEKVGGYFRKWGNVTYVTIP